jgi:hypothetical protein
VCGVKEHAFKFFSYLLFVVIFYFPFKKNSNGWFFLFVIYGGNFKGIFGTPMRNKNRIVDGNMMRSFENINGNKGVQVQTKS